MRAPARAVPVWLRQRVEASQGLPASSHFQTPVRPTDELPAYGYRGLAVLLWSILSAAWLANSTKTRLQDGRTTVSDARTQRGASQPWQHTFRAVQ